jgi:hypothetical protein
MDLDDGFLAAQQVLDLAIKVMQRVLVLSKDDELALVPVGIPHNRVVLENVRKLIPLAILVGIPELKGLCLQVG